MSSFCDANKNSSVACISLEKQTFEITWSEKTEADSEGRLI